MTPLPHHVSQTAGAAAHSRSVSGGTVLNALLVSQSPGASRMLTVVRRPGVNPRHPGVVSLPTMRIPAAVAPLLPPRRRPEPQGEVTFHRLQGARQMFGVPGAGLGLASFLTESLLSRKLGAAELLENGQLTGWCSFRMVAEGAVDDPTGTTDSEFTLMHTILVQVTTGAHHLPRESAAYSDIQWVDTRSFLLAWQRRDAQSLFPRANPFEICIRGLCIKSGVELLRAADCRFELDGDATDGGVVCP